LEAINITIGFRFRRIDEEQVTATADSATFGWTKYYELEEIEAWLDGILEAYPSVTEEFIVGQSYEGRNIRGIKISHRAGNPVIFIESNIHAREWITSASATWFINQLLTSEDSDVRNLAENYDWHIIPVFNVDGFEYSHKKVGGATMFLLIVRNIFDFFNLIVSNSRIVCGARLVNPPIFPVALV